MEESERLFEDSEFPADDSSIFSDGSSPLAQLAGGVAWLRPQEISGDPTMFPAERRQGHAKQGLLGDCWLLCAIEVLLRDQTLMEKVFPPGQPQWGEPGYDGSFFFQIWQRGRWVGVRLDDRLPCKAGAVCFSRCLAPNAYWVSLLEKAYAKLRGSYAHLWAGQVDEALVDLTGGIAERWTLSDTGSEEAESQTQGRRRARLDLDNLKHVQAGGTISASTHGTATGACEPGQHHALSIVEWTDVKTNTGDKLRLLRLRNPWGRGSWGGAWEDSGERWGQLDPVCARELRSQIADGEFWMEEAEFLKEFDEVTVGYPIGKQGFVQSIYTGHQLPHTCLVKGCWVKGHSDGGSRNSNTFCANPKYWLCLSGAGELVVALQQHRAWRTEGMGQPEQGARHRAIGFHVWKVEKKKFNLTRTLSRTPCMSTCHCYQREVVSQAQLPSGYYLLIPSTFHPGAEASFLLRAFSTAPLTLSAVKAPPPPPATPDWHTSYTEGSWVPGVSAGGSRNFPSHTSNPRVALVVANEDGGDATSPNVRIALRQHQPVRDLLPIGFHVYQVPAGSSWSRMRLQRDPSASCVPHCHAAEVTLQCRLSPGSYAVVPSTYRPHCAGRYTLSVAQRLARRATRSRETLGRFIQESCQVSALR